MKLAIPELALVVLVGASGSGKSTFARKHFKATEVLSSDFCRGLVSDDENSQAASADAFEVLHFVAAKRLARQADGDRCHHVQQEARKPLVALAREYHCLPVAIALDLPERLCQERNLARPDRNFGPHFIRQQSQQLRRSLRALEREGFRHVHLLSSPEDVETVAIERQPLWSDRRDERGPFDIIGDIHGCRSELESLLVRLGYDLERAQHPEGRKVVFLGDLVDRGPDIPGVLRIVMKLVAAGAALCVPGNHELKLLRKLRGKDVQVKHGLAESLAQLEREPPEFVESVKAFIDDLVSHYVLDDGQLVVAHAGMKESMQGRGSSKVRAFALYGETTGETDEFGLPVRYDWAREYRGRALVVYGHTPVLEPEWLNGTINVDTGCVFGGRLTALRYPEKELASVPAEQIWCQPARPFLAPSAGAPARTAQQEDDDVLLLQDVLGKRVVTTRIHHSITIREENAIAALEAMSRFAANSRWLIYLPPTMSPPETAREGQPVASIDDLRLAPFQLLASEGRVHVDQSHGWHLETLARLSGTGDPVIMATSSQLVELAEPTSEASAVRWWEEPTARGGEGMVVKPLQPVAPGRRGIVQPAVKCRGPEYLRLIYGLEYTLPEHLERLRARGLSVKRSLALREFALGIEALERFVRKEPLRRVHECVFGVLALESEPVVPRL